MKRIICSITTILFCGLLSAQSLDTTFTVYGPRKFVRSTGTPKTITESFAIPAAAESPYKLYVINGEWDGTNRVSSAEVKVNGVLVIRQSDLSQLIAYLERPVSLSSRNTIEVQLSSQPQAFLTIGITATDRTPPRLTVTSPPNGFITASSPITVTGTVFDETVVNLTVNGVSTTVGSDGSFSGQVQLSEGRNLITFIATDAASNSSSVDHIVIRDTAPPFVSIAAPTDNLITNVSRLSVNGTAFDSTSITLTLNGQPVTVGANGNWSGQLTLVEGRNSVTLVASDEAGNSTTIIRTLILDTTPPDLTITLPSQGAITNQGSIQVTGTVIDSTAVTLTVNDAVVALSVNGSFTTQVSLMEGTNTITLVANDAAGNSTSASRMVIRDSFPPDLTVSQPLDSSSTPDSTITVSGTVFDSTIISLTINGDTVAISSEGAFNGLVLLAQGVNQLLVHAEDAAGNVSSLSLTITRLSIILPPDPATVAPAIDNTVATALYPAVSFLFEGASPIQTGVVPGSINPIRVSVIRGRVLTRDLQPLSGVRVTILDHPEFGSTLSRADGRFDMAVNGGGLLTVNYSKEGYLPAQRQAKAQWQDYTILDDVILIPLDAQVTAIDFSQPIQVGRGSVVTDADGTRQATLLFKQGTQATLVFPRYSLVTIPGCTGNAAKVVQVQGDSLVPIPSISVRATEYTVGSNGPQTMPALLPPTSAYTYAVELSSDEAIAAGARQVRFSQPVSMYVENFLGFPAGIIAPVGYYDRVRGVWVPSPNGRVIRILNTTSGIAAIDANEDGVADDSTSLAALGFNDAERQSLAVLYTPGQTLWRVELTHFTSTDLNWNTLMGLGASPPNQPGADQGNPPIDGGDQSCGSIIGIQNQTLGEEFPITGTPYTLRYESLRAPGRKDEYTVTIPLSGSTIPSILQSIDLDIQVAGRSFEYSFAPAANLKYTFTWDGKDVYGRTVQGKQKIKVRILYVYATNYQTAPPVANSFGIPSGSLVPLVPARQREALNQDWEGEIGSWRPDPALFGGMSLNMHHTYERVGRVLHLGTGERRSAKVIDNVISTVAGIPTSTVICDEIDVDGIPARGVILGLAWSGFAVDPDGSLIFAASYCGLIRQIDPQGLIQTIAGNAHLSGTYSGDGGLARCGKFGWPVDVARAPDGSLYIADQWNNNVRRISPDGILSTVAGTLTPGFSGDGGPATQARLYGPTGVVMSADGSLYIADYYNHRVRKVSPDGIITTVAGTGSAGFSGDGGPGVNASLRYPSDLAFTPDGSLLIADALNHRIRKLSADGIITTVAGGGSTVDVGPATQASLAYPYFIAIGRDGTLYIADYLSFRIRRVSTDGIISTIAGNATLGYGGDDGPATAARVSYLGGLALAPDGSLYINDSHNGRIRKVAPPLPGVSINEIVVASEDGNEMYIFDLNGKHLRTLDALTGVVKHQFGYDANGFLTSITDIDSLMTSIERSAEGRVTAMISPYGQRTTFAMNADGYITSVTNPNNETVLLNYTTDGLLTSMKDPKGNEHKYFYDSLGRLVRDENPAGGIKTLTRRDTTNGFEVTVTTAEGREGKYHVEKFATGDVQRTNTDASGLKTVMVDRTNGTTTTTTSDGTLITRTDGPDPRFGMQAPVIKNMTVRLPSGLRATMSQGRLITQMSGHAVTGITDSVIVNGNVFKTTYDGNQRLTIAISAEGRKVFTRTDVRGRVIQDSIPGFAATTYAFDSKGRMTETSQGGRKLSYAYDAQGRLASITDPLQHTTSFVYDSVGRLTRQILPDQTEIAYSYDANGNLTSISPPGKPAHTFEYTANDLTEEYLPPFAGDSARATSYEYNLDNDLTRIVRPDSTFIDIEYGAFGCGCATLSGLPKTITFDRGQLQFAYDTSKGLLKTITAPGGNALSYLYDGSLPLRETWSGEVSGNVEVTYDNNFRVALQRANGGNTASFIYDKDGLLMGSGVLKIRRAPTNGMILSDTLNGLVTARGYDIFGDLASYTAKFGAATLFQTTYVRDSLGRIIQLDETIQGDSRTLKYKYDQVGRLIEVRRNDTLISTYTYDPNGNRLSHTSSSETVGAAYDVQDRLLTYGTASYIYTKNGELVTKIVGPDTTRYRYDFLGNLVSVKLPNGSLIEYRLDPQSRRIGKKVNGVLIKRQLYEGMLRPLAELDSAGNIIARYVYGTKVNVPEYIVKSGALYRLVTDHLGSPRLVVNATTGDVLQRMDFDEFGDVLLDTNPGLTPFGFAGGIYDHQTKLTRFGARDYDASVGRWTAKDPIKFWGADINLYEYASNSPLNFLDAPGLFSGPQHYDLSYWVTREFGFSQRAADKIAQASVDADVGTQGITVGHTRIHAMAGYNSELGRYENRVEAIASTASFVTEQLVWANVGLAVGDCEQYYRGLGWALHAVQDRWATGHDYAPWYGSYHPSAIQHTHLTISPEQKRNALTSSRRLLSGDIQGALR